MAADADPALDAAVRAIDAWRGRRPVATPIEEGRTNRNFRIDVGPESFFLRLTDKETELLGIDRRAEHDAALAAAVAGVGPEVFAFLPELGCMVTRWLAADPIPEADLEREDVLSRVVASVRAIHAGPEIRWAFSPFRIVEDYRKISEERGVPIPPAFDGAHERAARIEAAFGHAPIPPRSCHNDLLNANFLTNGDRVWIVDHEYAGMGDPFFDLGNLSINNGLSEVAQETLLRLYFGEVTDAHRARLKLMRIMSDFREAMWGVVQQGLSTLDINYVAYADMHFARLQETMADDRFERWLGEAAAPIELPAGMP